MAGLGRRFLVLVVLIVIALGANQAEALAVNTSSPALRATADSAKQRLCSALDNGWGACGYIAQEKQKGNYRDCKVCTCCTENCCCACCGNSCNDCSNGSGAAYVCI